MVLFFFYDKLTNIELIKKINEFFEINDGFVFINNYNSLNNILEISDKSINNNILLHGKIINFNMKIEDIMIKINEIEECRFKNKIKYTMDTIWANKKYGGVCKTYIIY
jgi:hypothetical protein